jgi:hypothetical protein
VEWQLSHSAEIKGVIDRGWGVVHMKHKKSNVEVAQETQPLPDSDPYSKPTLLMVPLGQDAKKKRYWAIDGGSIFISLFICTCLPLQRHVPTAEISIAGDISYVVEASYFK